MRERVVLRPQLPALLLGTSQVLMRESEEWVYHWRYPLQGVLSRPPPTRGSGNHGRLRLLPSGHQGRAEPAPRSVRILCDTLRHASEESALLEGQGDPCPGDSEALPGGTI